MAFHISNLGRAANTVREYADLDGYVPEAGDSWGAFRRDALEEAPGKDVWEEFVAAAVEATAKAAQALENWREAQV